jgi:hypothetical protein
MPNLERQPYFEKDTNPPKRKQFGGGLYKLGKKFAVTGALVAGLAATEQARPVFAQEATSSLAAQTDKNPEAKEKTPARFPIIFDSITDDIMRKTQVKFWGNGLRVYRSKQYIDLLQDGSVSRVEITAMGQLGLSVKIYKKSEKDEPTKIIEIKIFNGFLQETPGQKPKE